ncbi:folate-binding protein [Marinicauda salina]|uniref:Folate-binding protein n=1 Tax=Marinicauda salina TaxID=2135793 RepID=A0A2U2BUE8_9PROT|nr:folate-binding protein YgfZ [Marinicauda salina]PWE17609.1 folate-binding protein [Marinicauda salina]
MTDAPDFLTALPDRAVIRITGADARSFLQRVITRGPEDLPDGGAIFSALLTPQGKILADFVIFDDGEGGLYLDTPASEAEALAKRLAMYRLRAKAEIAIDAELAVAAARGEGEAELKTVAHAIAPAPRSAALGVRAIVTAGGPEDVDAYDAARIAAGVPEFGRDYGAGEVFSTDVNHDRLGGIDYRKGCFVGQEVASRMHRKGGVRKRTLRFALEGGSPEAGAAVTAGEKKVGEVTSAADGLALALVRVDRLAKAVEDGGAITLGEAAARLLDDLDAMTAA